MNDILEIHLSKHMLLHVLMTVRGKFVFTSENQRKIMITCDYIMCSFVDKI